MPLPLPAERGRRKWRGTAVGERIVSGFVSRRDKALVRDWSDGGVDGRLRD